MNEKQNRVLQGNYVIASNSYNHWQVRYTGFILTPAFITDVPTNERYRLLTSGRSPNPEGG